MKTIGPRYRKHRKLVEGAKNMVLTDALAREITPHRCYMRTVEVDGQPIAYYANASTDPETIKALDELVAAVKHQFQNRAWG